MNQRLIDLLTPLAEAIPSTISTKLPADDDLISLQEAARLLGCTERHVHRHLQHGRLSSIREGRKHRLKRSDVEDLVLQHRS